MKAAGKKFPLQKERCVEHANMLEIEIPWDIGITRFDGMNYEGYKLKTAFGNLERVKK